MYVESIIRFSPVILNLFVDEGISTTLNATPPLLKPHLVRIGCKTRTDSVSKNKCRAIDWPCKLIEHMADTMDVQNIHLTNFIYQGGDDCVAVKPRSYNVYVKNAVCRGGNGMAIGSLGQYFEDATVENTYMDNVTVSKPSFYVDGSKLMHIQGHPLQRRYD